MIVAGQKFGILDNDEEPQEIGKPPKQLEMNGSIAVEERKKWHLGRIKRGESLLSSSSNRKIKRIGAGGKTMKLKEMREIVKEYNRKRTERLKNTGKEVNERLKKRLVKDTRLLDPDFLKGWDNFASIVNKDRIARKMKR